MTEKDVTHARATKTMCKGCHKLTESGTHNGCVECGKVKHTESGFKNPPKQDQEEAA